MVRGGGKGNGEWLACESVEMARGERICDGSRGGNCRFSDLYDLLLRKLYINKCGLLESKLRVQLQTVFIVSF